MAVKSLAQSSILQPSTTKSMLAGYESNYFHHLETVRLGGNAASVTFSNLSRYSDYQHLQLRMVARGTRAAALDYTEVTFNDDAGSNYSIHGLQGNGGAGTVTSSASASTGYVYFGALPANTATASSFSASVIDILDPFDTTKAKTIRALWGLTEGTWKLVNLTSGRWGNTSAINSMKIELEVGPAFAAGSRFSLYGLKARA